MTRSLYRTALEAFALTVFIVGAAYAGNIVDSAYSLAPACATGSRLDNTNGSTTNGNHLQIWAAGASDPNQLWSFANLSGNSYQLTINSGLDCLDSGGAATGGSAATIWACGSGNENQSWLATAVTGGFTFKDANAGLCLNVTGAGSANGTAVDTASCNGTNAQSWSLNGSTTGGGIANGAYSLAPACATATRLDNTNGSTTNGNHLQIWASTGGPNQSWTFSNVGGSRYALSINSGTDCVDSGGATTNGSPATIWACGAGNANQTWSATAVNGGYTLSDANAGLCLDVAGSGTANGTAVDTYACNGTTAQTWALSSAGSTGSTTGGTSTGSTTGTTGSPPNFGPNVIIITPSMSASTINSTVNNIWNQQKGNQFGTQRYAILFQPGTYNGVDLNVGYYMQLLGLGSTPDSTTINGYVQQPAESGGSNATLNFWSGVENMAINPQDSGGTDMWAVSQADPMRRVHIKGNIVLSQNNGYGSGGWLSDSLIDGQISSGPQQQWISRNCQWGNWNGGNWNMVFVGDDTAPSGGFPSYTRIAQTPVAREKPFLTFANGAYSVFVPSLRNNTAGTTWSGATEAGTSLPISSFYIARSSSDNAATINTALSQGKNILLTPGVYKLGGTIDVNNANTVVLGLGLATLQANSGQDAMHVADVDGVTVAGVLFETGSNMNTLLTVGPSGSSTSHAGNPTLLADLFFRVGGAVAGTASNCLAINSNNVIGDDFWIWRADHGTDAGWNSNTCPNGLIVNGQNVTIYGLAVEHFQQFQTLWNGNGGRTYFYQSELPYDPPSESAWMNGSEQGWASYKVSGSVTSHQAFGLGIYAVFVSTGANITEQNAIEAPQNTNVQFTDMVTISLKGTIWNIINFTGNSVSSSNFESSLGFYN